MANGHSSLRVVKVMCIDLLSLILISHYFTQFSFTIYCKSSEEGVGSIKNVLSPFRQQSEIVILGVASMSTVYRRQRSGLWALICDNYQATVSCLLYCMYVGGRVTKHILLIVNRSVVRFCYISHKNKQQKLLWLNKQP